MKRACSCLEIGGKHQVEISHPPPLAAPAKTIVCIYDGKADSNISLEFKTKCTSLQLNSRGEILNDSMFRSASSADYILRAAKVVTLVDLAGHERYFKTTAYGLTGHLPDYACLIVSANNGEYPPPPPHTCTHPTTPDPPLGQPNM